MSLEPDSHEGPRELPPSGATHAEARHVSLSRREPSRVYVSLPEDREMHFWDYWRVLMRYRWTAVLTFLAFVLGAAAYVYLSRPVYTATATLQLDNPEPNVVKFEDVVATTPNEAYRETQLKILKSRALANRVIALVGLERHPDFQVSSDKPGLLSKAWDSVVDRVSDRLAAARERVEAKVTTWLPGTTTGAITRSGAGGPAAGATAKPAWEPKSGPPAASESPITDAFLGRLAVNPVEQSLLVEVDFDSHDPVLAANVANALTETFIAQDVEQKLKAAEVSTTFLARQLDDARRKSEESEDRLNRFLKANDILILNPGSTDGPDLGSEALKRVSDDLLQARADRIAKESALTQAQRQDPSALAPVLQSDLVRSLKNELQRAEAEYRQLSQTFKPGYPRMQQLMANIEDLRRQIEAETQKVVHALEGEYRTARLKEEQLDRVLNRQRGFARRLGDQMAEYNIVRRDVDTNRRLYAQLLAKREEMGVASGLIKPGFLVVDRASVPLGPSKPRKSLILSLAGFVGLFGGVGLAFFRQYLDRTITGPAQVEAALKVPVLAVIPAREALESRRARERLGGLRGGGPFELVAHEHASSLIAEAFRTLRTSLLLSRSQEAPKSVLVSSLQAGDGKTSLATNLAIVLGQLDTGPVLLVDADMRRPTLHAVLRVPQEPGLSAYLADLADLDEVIRPTGIPNLSVIPSGNLPRNPVELLSTPRLTRLLEEVEGRFSHVVFDGTPLFGVSDAMVVASRVDGVILVLRHGGTTQEAAQRAIVRLDAMGARLRGVVLNDVDLREVDRYSDYTYYGYAPAVPRRRRA